MSHGTIHHVELNVSDLGRSEAFWGWLLGELGYSEYQRWDGGRSWRLGETYIVLVQTEAEHLASGYHRRRTGLNHLAFHVESRDTVDQFTTELRRRGVPLLYEDRHPHAGGSETYAVFFEDPDRVKVELAAPVPSSAWP